MARAVAPKDAAAEVRPSSGTFEIEGNASDFTRCADWMPIELEELTLRLNVQPSWGARLWA